MLYWALGFFLGGLVAGVVSFGAIGDHAAWWVRLAAFVLLGLSLASLVVGMARKKQTTRGKP